MSRDRLAEARAAAKSNGPASVEMTSITRNTKSSSSQPTSYLDEISRIKLDIQQFKALISRISSLNQQALDLISEKQQQEHSLLANEVTSEAKRVRQQIKQALQALASYKLRDASEENIRHGQYVTLKRQFMDLIASYHKVEQQHHQQVKARMERQYRIVRPEATDDEVREAVEGGDTSVFAQSVLQSAKADEAKRAFREVRERHMDIQNIVKSIEELNTLYHEMQYLVESQDVLVENIDKQVETANVQLEEVNAELGQATETAKKSRKKRWFLTMLGIAILAVIIVAILATLMPSHKSEAT